MDVEIEVNNDDATPEAVEVVETGGSDDVVMDATTISLVERVTRLEDALNVAVAAMTELSHKVESLSVSDEIQDQQIQQVQETVEEVATEAADAIETAVEEVDEASEEVTAEELPATRSHPFFRKWGKGSSE